MGPMFLMIQGLMRNVNIRCNYLCHSLYKAMCRNARCWLLPAMVCPLVALVAMCLFAETWTYALVRLSSLCVLVFMLCLVYKLKYRKHELPWSTSKGRGVTFHESFIVSTPERKEIFLHDVEEGAADEPSPLTPTTMSRLGAQENKLSWIGKPMQMKHSTYIRLDEELGRGASKTVWLAQDLNNEKRVAWSMIHMAHLSKKENTRAIQELALLMSHSPYRKKREGGKAADEGTLEAGEERLVRLLDMMEGDTYIHVITELIDGGSLRRWSIESGLAKGRPAIKQEMDDLCKVANHISHGLAWLHLHHIIHRDVRPENILIKLFPGSDSTRIQSAVLADMGLFSFCPVQLNEKISIAGRDEYLAPEIVRQMIFDDTTKDLFDIKFSANYCSKVDVWMVGLCIAEIPTNQLPSINLHRCSDFAQYTDALEQRIEGTLRKMGYEDHALHSFLRGALVIDPVHRAGSAELWEMLQSAVQPAEQRPFTPSLLFMSKSRTSSIASIESHPSYMSDTQRPMMSLPL